MGYASSVIFWLFFLNPVLHSADRGGHPPWSRLQLSDPCKAAGCQPKRRAKWSPSVTSAVGVINAEGLGVEGSLFSILMPILSHLIN